MSYITRVGNLATLPKLKHGEHGPYLYARILVTDRIRRDGEWVDGPTVAYEVAVQKEQAVNLHRTAQESGNVRVLFSGRTWTDEYVPENGPARITHKVKADEIGISLQRNAVKVLTDEAPEPAAAESGPAESPAAPAPAAPAAAAPAAPSRGAVAHEELQNRVAALVNAKHLTEEEGQRLNRSAESLAAERPNALALFMAVIATTTLSPAASLYLTCVFDAFDGAGELLSWDEADARTQTVPAPFKAANVNTQPWAAVSEIRADLHGGGPTY